MIPVLLTTDCPRCRGNGLIPGPQMPEECPECSGRGKLPTEAGKTIMGLWRLAIPAP